MRQLTLNLINTNLNALAISAVDEPRLGEPNRRYLIGGFNTASNPGNRGGFPALHHSLSIFFHEGPMFSDQQLNGVTPEALIMVVADHLQTKMNTPDACREYEEAIGQLYGAVGSLSRRIDMRHLSNDGYPALGIAV